VAKGLANNRYIASHDPTGVERSNYGRVFNKHQKLKTPVIYSRSSAKRLVTSFNGRGVEECNRVCDGETFYLPTVSAVTVRLGQVNARATIPKLFEIAIYD
jgi:hypothetical protein